MLIDAKSVLLVLGGAATAVGLKKGYDYYAADDDLDEAVMVEIYLEKGPGGLARVLKREGHAEDRDEALDMVGDFEEDNEDIVRKYARRVARKEEREEARVVREAARKSRTGRRTAMA